MARGLSPSGTLLRSAWVTEEKLMGEGSEEEQGEGEQGEGEETEDPGGGEGGRAEQHGHGN